jgi:hypothetical protein
MTLLQTVLGTAALFGAITSSAFATTITHTTTFGPATTDFTNTLSIGQLVIPVGFHLTGVTLDISSAVASPTLSLTNTSATAQTFGLNLSEVISVDSNSASGDAVGDQMAISLFSSGAGLVPPKTIHLGVTGLGACPANTPSVTCSSVSYTGIAGAADDGVIDISAANWANYVGTGNIVIGFDTSASTQFNGGGGNIALSQVTNASVAGTVTWTFVADTSTPEPATTALMGVALLGLGLLRKRVRR